MGLFFSFNNEARWLSVKIRALKSVARRVPRKRLWTPSPARTGMTSRPQPTSDKLKGVVKKWQSLIECYVDAKPPDGYIVRVGVIGFTDRCRPEQKTCYAQSTQIRKIRARMTEIITRDVSSGTVKELVEKLIPDSIADSILKRCRSIYPMQEVHTRKVKVLKRPKLDRARLMEAHEESGGKVTDPKTGETISKPKYEPKVQESV